MISRIFYYILQPHGTFIWLPWGLVQVLINNDTLSGAGFYVNATEEPWKTNYRMYSYVTAEVFHFSTFPFAPFCKCHLFQRHRKTIYSNLFILCPCKLYKPLPQIPTVISSNFNVNMQKSAISGHSMGGHGALISALKNPGKYKVLYLFKECVNCLSKIENFISFLPFLHVQCISSSCSCFTLIKTTYQNFLAIICSTYYIFYNCDIIIHFPFIIIMIINFPFQFYQQ